MIIYVLVLCIIQYLENLKDYMCRVLGFISEVPLHSTMQVIAKGVHSGLTFLTPTCCGELFSHFLGQ
jgi:hypothetical protein